nr:MAG: non-structural protein [Canine parvovirus]
MVFNPCTLYDICKRKVGDTFQTNWEYVEVLPERINDDVFRSFLTCAESFTLDNTIDDSLVGTWQDILPITKKKLIALMCHPNEVPAFANEHNCVIFNYYNLFVGGQQFKYCYKCYTKISKRNYPWAGNYWSQMNWVWTETVSHDYCSAECLMEFVIWKRDSWCHQCMTSPLFTIQMPEECMDVDHVAVLDYNPDETIYLPFTFTSYSTVCVPNRVDNLMYKFLKKEINSDCSDIE